MDVPKDFILATLFSEIGRLQKRAEGTPGSVREVSQKWLAEKIPNAAETLTTWGSLIDKAALLALGSAPADTDQQRLAEETRDSTRPLVSLFSKVPIKTPADIDSGSYPPEQVCFPPLRTLSEESPYPVEIPKAPGYSELWGRFNNEIKTVGSAFTPDAALVLLANYTTQVPHLSVEGDLRSDPFSDISLFDHLKMTAAIASCLYAYGIERCDGREEEAARFEPRLGDQPYLLVGGDFSGVQEFIYRISSKGALKAVRGRSFFLELLTQHVVVELLEATGCSKANVLYAAGAQFSLLLPNTADAQTQVTRIRREANTYLIQVHSGKLSLILESQECSNVDLLGKEKKEKKGWAYARAELGGRIGRSKGRKFVEFFQNEEIQDRQEQAVLCCSCEVSAELVGKEELERWGLKGPLCRFCFLLIPKSSREDPEAKAKEVPFPQDLRQCQWCKARDKQPVICRVGEEIITGCRHEFCLGKMQPGECQVCHRQTLLSPLPTPDVQTVIENKLPDAPDRILACPFCRNLYHLGEHLPELECVRRTEKPPSVQPRMIFNIGRWFYDFPPKAPQLKESLRDDPKSQGWLVKETREVNHYLAIRPVSPLPLGNYHPSVKALDFSDLAKASTGAQLIGVLRMDVDNLGELFTQKIPEATIIPVRTSALSRLLTRFFTGFINALCEGEGLPPDHKEPFCLLPERRPSRPSKKRWVTVVYSGGDDLFIVGAWSDVIELAFDIRTAFRRYVCDHPDITLSGGMVVQPEDFPLYQMANLAKDAEEKAKENKDFEGKEKNSFTPFYLRGQKAFSWKKAETLRELAVTLVKDLEDKKALGDNRLHLNVPRTLLTQLFEIVEIYKQEGKLYLPRLAYILAHDAIPKELKQKLLSLETINYLHPALVWLELLSRGEGSHVGS